MVYSEITWIFVVATFGAVFVAYGIGANDVANSFGTSVGAGALSMKQALLVATICEFGGAVLMGSGVTDTIRNQIADVDAFEEKPDVFAYGMLCAMMASGTWLILATYWEIPVSTTHSIVGAVVGMTMVAAGPDAVHWSEKTSSFPFLGGVSSIALSWLFSPLLTGGLALGLFLALRTLVLRSPHAYQRAYYVLPFFVFMTFFMISMFIIQQGGARFEWDHTPLGTAAWISAVVGAVTTAAAVAVQWLLIRKRVAEDLKSEEVAAAAHAAAAAAAAAAEMEQAGQPQIEEADSLSNKPSSIALGGVPSLSTGGFTLGGSPTAARGGGGPGGPGGARPGAAAHALGDEEPHSRRSRTPAALHKFRESRLWSVLTHGANFDIHEVVDTDEKIASIHYHSERFDWKAESVFKYLQVFTAMANSFAHGSNDVANAVGPYAAIYFVWQHSSVQMSSEVPIWILAVGGAGLVLGLATYGYKIMRILGVKMTRLSNSRGFVIEISAATIVFIGSRFGLPISTTHCLVGAVAGIGLLEGRKGFNWVLMLRFFVGWVVTLVLAGLTSALFTAQGIYAPNNNSASRREYMADYLEASTAAISAALAGSGVPGTWEASAALNASLAALASPLLNIVPGAQLQQQALIDIANATTWVAGSTQPQPFG
ncbi:Phosphate-repressible phosphate permease isoform A [Micractinium conductrix]|uniref:Phosphate transporter n=1 Tax=Micractinium conductrix TaxID=554055 RepID=A0A2P6V262_9CHLO|nr:Phosphate-repressible phosphate permease isoform A [Micractinium conductrix]|eukprot:PSC68172.1 Phosphate-repressible phosphate permease isoform A [Micractinium conductrix]